jgi:hypothetical protein
MTFSRKIQFTAFALIVPIVVGPTWDRYNNHRRLAESQAGSRYNPSNETGDLRRSVRLVRRLESGLFSHQTEVNKCEGVGSVAL